MRPRAAHGLRLRRRYPGSGRLLVVAVILLVGGALPFLGLLVRGI